MASVSVSPSVPTSVEPFATPTGYPPQITFSGWLISRATLPQLVADFEREVIQASLAAHDGHRIETAAALGVSRVTLYNKMRAYGLLVGPQEGGDV